MPTPKPTKVNAGATIQRLELFVLKIRWVVLLIVTFLGGTWYGTYLQDKHAGGEALALLESAVLSIKETPTNVEQLSGMIQELSNGIQQPAPPEGTCFTVGRDSIPVDKDFLYCLYDSENRQFEVRVQNLQSKKIHQRWRISYSKLVDVYNKWYASDRRRFLAYGEHSTADRLQTPLEALIVLPGNRVAGRAGRMLICLDTEGNIVWNSPELAHHSTELDHEQNLWICSLLADGDILRRTEAIAKLDIQTGKTLYKKSITDIFLENPNYDLSHLNQVESDPFHLNDIQPVLADSEHWRRGDLFISLRNISTVFLYRPSTGKILWCNSSYWANQHDVELLDDHRISVFDNNIVRGLSQDIKFKHGRLNRCMIYDFRNGRAEPDLVDTFETQDIRTPIQGRLKIHQADELVYIESSEQHFFVVADLAKQKSWKCVLPGNSPGKVGYLTWFRLLADNPGTTTKAGAL